MQINTNLRHLSNTVIHRSIIKISLVLSVFVLVALFLQFSVGFVSTNSNLVSAATPVNSLIVTNCDLDGKGSLIPRFGISNGNNWYTIDASGGRTANENLPILCNNKSFAENIANLERSSYFDLEVKTSLLSNTCAYTATPTTYMIRFASQACSDGTALGKGVLKNLSSFPISQDSVLHVSYCKSNTSVTDILPLINIDSNPALISQCDGIASRSKSEPDQSIKLFVSPIPPKTAPSTTPTYKTPAYPNLPDLVDWSLQASSDFNNDGNVDVLWKNRTTGHLVLWYLNGRGNFMSGTNTPIAGDGTYVGVKLQDLGYNVSAVGDIDGDGNKDIIWSHPTGQRVIWYLNSQRQIISGDILPYASTTWDVVTTVDTNNDKKDDLIFKSRVGENVVVWRSNRVPDVNAKLQYSILNGSVITTLEKGQTIYGAYQSQLQKGTNRYTIQTVSSLGITTDLLFDGFVRIG
jgi:hypothetical protein